MRRAGVVVAMVVAVACAVPAGALAGNRDAAAVGVYGGLGSWLDIFAAGSWSQPRTIVAHAKAAGVRTLYLQTSNYSQRVDVVRPAELGRFVDAAHAAGLKAVAWYLPGFASPALDVRRALAAVRFRSASGQRFDGFGLDIEASIVPNVGLRNRRLLALARTLRAAVPPTYPLAAIIPSPVGMRRHPHYWPGFPYAPLARTFDAFLPMAYFSYYAHTGQAAYTYARNVVQMIRTGTGDADALIHMIGGSSTSIPPAALAGFVRASSECGVQGISLYAFPQTSALDWRLLGGAALAGPVAASCGG